MVMRVVQDCNRRPGQLRETSEPRDGSKAEEPRTVLNEVERWLATRSWSVTDRPLHRIMAAKRGTGRTVSVVLPALNEEETVGDIVSVIRHDLMQRAPLADEFVAGAGGPPAPPPGAPAAAGAGVPPRDDTPPPIPAVPGKGEVLWRSLLATSGDIVC